MSVRTLRALLLALVVSLVAAASPSEVAGKRKTQRGAPTAEPTAEPTAAPTAAPTAEPTAEPTPAPTSPGGWQAPTNAFHVSPSGSDSAPGTREQPWRTIGKALATLQAGQTALLHAGVYAEAIGGTCGSAYNRVDAARSGTASAPITLAGAPGEEGQVVVKTHLSVRGNYVHVRNLVIDENRAYSSFDGGCTGGIGIAIWGDHAVVEGVEIRNAAMSGLYLENADHARILRNHIHHNGVHYNLDHGIYFKTGVAGLIANNIVESNYAQGIKLGPGPTGAVAAQNTVVRNGTGGKGSGIMICGDDVRVTTGARVFNNITTSNRDYGVRSYWETDVGTDNRVERNLMHGNAAGSSWYPRGGVIESASLLQSPGFVDLVSGDYRLVAFSPAISAANTARSYSPDYRSRARDDAPDLGAMEY